MGKNPLPHHQHIRASGPMQSQQKLNASWRQAARIRYAFIWAHIGNPLVGDPVYNKNNKVSAQIKGKPRAALQSFNRQALHARSLGFIHPIEGKLFKFESELPYDMKELLETLDAYRV